MANTKSAIKAARKSTRNAARNKTTISRLKTLRKKYDQAVGQNDAVAARAAGIAFASAMDKASKKGVVHANKASHAKGLVSKSVLKKA